ncbi:hypothetical protein Tco_1505969 [Tanacetum coccineum]
MESGTLFKRGYLVPMLRCIGPLLANYVIREIHMGSCGMHMGPWVVVRKAVRHGYYWPTMHEDAKKESTVGKRPVQKLAREVQNAPNEHDSSASSGKRVSRKGQQNPDGRHQNPPRKRKGQMGMWAHRTSIKQSNGETPFNLTYSSEAVIPAEIGIPTHQTLMIREEYNEEEMRLNLDLLQERRETTAVREVRYKSKMERYYNKKVRSASFRPGEFVFRRNEASRVEDQGKLGQKWEGPYRVIEAYETVHTSYKLWKIRRERISDKRTKNKAKNDKTKHGMKEREKDKVKVQASQSQSQQSKPKSQPKGQL